MTEVEFLFYVVIGFLGGIATVEAWTAVRDWRDRRQLRIHPRCLVCGIILQKDKCLQDHDRCRKCNADEYADCSPGVCKEVRSD